MRPNYWLLYLPGPNSGAALRAALSGIRMYAYAADVYAGVPIGPDQTAKKAMPKFEGAES